MRNATLLRVAHAEDDWPRWFKAVGVTKMRPKGPELEYSGQALQAAADGVGVAMGIHSLSRRRSAVAAAGRAVSAIGVKGEQWYLICRDARRDESAFQAFRAWMLNVARSAGRSDAA